MAEPSSGANSPRARPFFVRGAMLVVALIATHGCGSGPSGSDGEAPVCPAPSHVTRRLLPFQNGADAAALAASLAKYYQPLGIELVPSGEPAEVGLDYAIDNDEAELRAALALAFPHVDLDATAIDAATLADISRFIANHMLRPLLEFVRAWRGEPDETALVAVPSLTSDPAAASRTLAGLSISEALLAHLRAEAGPEGDLWRDAEFPPAFSPVMFVDATLLASFERDDPDFAVAVLAHEFGHTAGLWHEDDPDNLMHPNLVPGEVSHLELTGAQLARMAENLTPGCAPQDAAQLAPAPAPR
ncbi:matrixin family metalloprotease [Sorangium sp. So ce513]|uniref:matrixin family metalloprotease n=1 Tax=Sorangium sp. So ce513 TaxID=3133315 RepID=UPI003F5E091A